jgi:soluble lytic murein transglycosylase
MRSWWKRWQLTIPNSWGRTILVRSFKLLPLAAFFLSGAASPAQELEPLAKAFREKPTAANRLAVERFLLRHPKDSDGALARIVLYQGDTSASGLLALREARGPLKDISDYANWFAAATELAAKRCADALASAQRVLETKDSPVAPRAAGLALKCARELEDWSTLRSLLSKHQRLLSPSQVSLYGAFLAQSSGETVEARKLFAQTITQFPRTAEAAEALKFLPLSELSAIERLDRAYKLMDSGDAGAARGELTALLPRLDGAARELAQVRIGVCEYRLRSSTALTTLKTLQVKDSAADAERLFYLLLTARRLKQYEVMGSAMDALNREHPRSTHRLEALANAAGQYWVMGQSGRSLPLYEACAADFASRPEAKDCEWKAAVQHYILRKPGAEQRLEAYLRSDPAGEHNSAALYFLGRSAEARRDRGAAKAYYQQAIETFPNHFYAELCRERMAAGKLENQSASQRMLDSLRQIPFPQQAAQLSFDPSGQTRRRIARADLLARGALYEYAELELRHEARNSEQPHLLAMAAARMATRRGSPDQGIRYMKSLFPGYLSLPLNAATMPLWKLAYPMPYKDPLLTHAFKNGVDPYLLAGLIRQESEFSASVVSRANAHGLTQIMPATGRELARRLGIKGFTSKSLFDPSINLQMGSFYFKSLLNSLDGSLEQALASYNAGKGRVMEWLGRGSYEDPAEFIESIPFHETRGYVQSVIRNAGIYRRLYGNSAKAR